MPPFNEKEQWIDHQSITLFWKCNWTETPSNNKTNLKLERSNASSFLPFYFNYFHSPSSGRGTDTPASQPKGVIVLCVVRSWNIVESQVVIEGNSTKECRSVGLYPLSTLPAPHPPPPRAHGLGILKTHKQPKGRRIIKLITNVCIHLRGSYLSTLSPPFTSFSWPLELGRLRPQTNW